MEWAVPIMQAALDLKAGRIRDMSIDSTEPGVVLHFHVFPAKVEQPCEGGDFVDLRAQKHRLAEGGSDDQHPLRLRSHPDNEIGDRVRSTV
jgi:hypothetical protein